MDSPRDQLLPHGAENPDVWCERCQRIHKRHTFTQDDYDAVIAQGAKNLAAAIDKEILDRALQEAVYLAPKVPWIY